MSDNKQARAWLYGCGIGCGVALLLAASLFGAGYFYVKRIAGGFDEAAATSAALEERFGAPAAFTPAPDGAITAARMEAFLAVRDALAPARASLETTFARLPVGKNRPRNMKDLPFFERLTLGFSIGKAALGLGPEVGDFLRIRNRTMLDHGIGMGEYGYIYTIAYYAWLGHGPLEGPGDTKPGAAPGEGETSHPAEEGRAFHMMGGSTMDRVHGECLQMLRNQLASLPPGGPASWREALQKEIAAMAGDDARAPWQDGVPPAIGASLEPYRARLVAAWSPVTNPFELARSRRRGRMSYSAD